MSKFVVVDEAPANLNDGEYVIKEPDFIKEIADAEKYAAKLGSQRVTTVGHLKGIAENIRINYDPEGFDVITAIPYSKYEGVAYTNFEDLSQNVVLRMLNKYQPDIIDKYLDKMIKTRPENTNLVYFVGGENRVQNFLKNGLDREQNQAVTKTIKESEETE